MPLYTWHHQGARKPSSCATFTLSTHWGGAATGRKSLGSMHTGLLGSCLALCDPVDCGLSGFSVRDRGSPGNDIGACWPIPVAIPF